MTGWTGMGAIRICSDFFSRSIPSFQRHSIAKETITVLEAVILESFSSSRIIPVIQSEKSLLPPPSAEGGEQSDLTLHFRMSFQPHSVIP